MRQYIYEDELPEMTEKEYREWYDISWVEDGVRVGLIPRKMHKNGLIGFDNNNNIVKRYGNERS